MRFAVGTSGELAVEPAPGLAALCPECGERVSAKCGPFIEWHFAHEPGSLCPSSTAGAEAGITDWHLWWQACFPLQWRERVQHGRRADVLTPRGIAVEVQTEPPDHEPLFGRLEAHAAVAWIARATPRTRERWRRLTTSEIAAGLEADRVFADRETGEAVQLARQYRRLTRVEHARMLRGELEPSRIRIDTETGERIPEVADIDHYSLLADWIEELPDGRHRRVLNDTGTIRLVAGVDRVHRTPAEVSVRLPHPSWASAAAASPVFLDPGRRALDLVRIIPTEVSSGSQHVRGVLVSKAGLVRWLHTAEPEDPILDPDWKIGSSVPEILLTRPMAGGGQL